MTGAQQAQPEVRQPKPLVPVAASSIVDSPEAYYGQHVTLVGAVEEQLSDSAFTVDQDSHAQTGKELLILAPVLNGRLELNSYVTVIGEVVRFEPGQMGHLALHDPLNLPAHASAKYGGGPAVLATSVITPDLVDLARKLPLPLTPEEAAFDQYMKRVGGAYSALRQAGDASNRERTMTNAAVIKDTFREVEAFWKAREQADAIGWAQESRAHAEKIERAVAVGRWDAARESITSLGRTCQSCHSVHRERLDDGGYRIRKAEGKREKAEGRREKAEGAPTSR
jgi:hypothetical protein